MRGLGEHYESRKREQKCNMVSKQGGNVKRQSDVGMQECKMSSGACGEENGRIGRKGDNVVCGWRVAKNICKAKSPRGRINRLDV